MKNITRSLGIALSLALASSTAVLFNGCATTDRGDEMFSSAVDDNQLAQQVKTTLTSNPDYKLDGVQVVSHNGNLQLNGTVDTPYQKLVATTITTKVEGVKTVDNNLVVKNGG